MSAADTLQFQQIAKWSQVVCAIVFLIFLIWAVRKYLVPAIESAAKARNAELAAAEKHRDAMKTEVAQARAGVEAADRDALAIANRAKEDAARERQRILDEAKADGERTVRNAEGELGRGRIAANAALRAEFIDRALTLARKEAAAKIDDRENLRLVNNTVDSLSGGRG
jgi:F0F1-type ATP synthase membrane subunit b/b'